MERQYCKKCSNCHERSVCLAPIAYSTPVHLDGRDYEVAIPELLVPKCSSCGSFALDYEVSRQIDDAIRKQVDLLSPGEIRTHREAMALTQEQVAEQLRIEPKALERWENGEQIQPPSLDRTLRVFFKNPGAHQLVPVNTCVPL